MVNTKNSIKRALESGRLSLADVKSEIHQLESELKKQGVAEGSYTTEKQILTRIRQIMYDRKLSGTESNAGELHRLKQQLKDIRSQQDVSEGISVVKSDYDLDQMVITLDIEGKRRQFTYWDYDEDFENAERKDVFDQLQEQPWFKGLDHPTKMEILDASYKAIRGEDPSEYKPTVDDEPLDIDEGSGTAKYKVRSIGVDSRGDYYISPSTGEKVYKSGVKVGDHENPKTGKIIPSIKEQSDTPEEEMDRTISDLHKDVYGFRPDREFGREWMAMSYDEKLKLYYSMIDQLDEQDVSVSEAKKDSCYHKVRSRYKVWPSAYASGALVQCRKKGAKNWGNKSK
jgi:hypothetical protein